MKNSLCHSPVLVRVQILCKIWTVENGRTKYPSQSLPQQRRKPGFEFLLGLEPALPFARLAILEQD